MKNIIFLSNYFPKFPGHTTMGTWALNQVNAIATENNVHVISFTPHIPNCLAQFLNNQKLKNWSNIYKDYELNENIKIYYPRYNPLLYKQSRYIRTHVDYFSNRFFRKIEKLIVSKKPDLIIANQVLIEGAIAEKIYDKYSIPYIVFEHSPTGFKPINNKHFNYYNKVVKNSKLFITVSEYAMGEIKKYYHIENGEILYNYSLDAKDYKDKFKEKLNIINTNRKYIIEVGNFEKRKNHINLLKVFNGIKNDFPTWDLIFIGGHNETLYEINNYIIQNNLKDRVHILQSVPHEEVLFWLNYTDIFVLPSDDETFGVAALEAITANIPIIVTKNSGFIDKVFNDSSVFLIDSKDNETLGKYLKMLMSDHGIRYNAANNNRQIYDIYFTKEVYSKNINKIIETVCLK